MLILMFIVTLHVVTRMPAYIPWNFIIMYRNLAVAASVTIFVVQQRRSPFVPNFPGDKSFPVCAHKISSLYFHRFGSFAH